MGKLSLDISRLTADEKLALIDDLWRSLSPDDLPLSAEVRSELDRRLERLDREGPTGFDWDDIRAEMSIVAP